MEAIRIINEVWTPSRPFILCFKREKVKLSPRIHSQYISFSVVWFYLMFNHHFTSSKNEDIEIGRLLKETLADSNARFEGKREKYIFSENVLPTRRKRNLSSIKFYHICKDRENPLFCCGASSRKTFRQSNSFEDKSDIF